MDVDIDFDHDKEKISSALGLSEEELGTSPEDVARDFDKVSEVIERILESEDLTDAQKIFLLYRMPLARNIPDLVAEVLSRMPSEKHYMALIETTMTAIQGDRRRKEILEEVKESVEDGTIKEAENLMRELTGQKTREVK